MGTGMATRQSAIPAHACECGECFDSTEELLAHVEEVHRFSPL